MVQVPSEGLTPMLPAMDGIDTFTMVMSRISMKLDRPMAMVRKTSSVPCSGGYSPGATLSDLSSCWAMVAR
jgi:hypothetical protein